MAQLNIGGHTLTVDDAILSLPKDEQQKVIESILSDSKVKDLLSKGGTTIPANQMSAWESAKEGFMDPYVGLGQFREHAAGRDVTAVDRSVVQREEDLSRRGIDPVARLGGSIANPLNLMTAGATEGASLAGAPALARLGLGAASGGSAAVMQPVTGEDFGTEKAIQAGAGTAAGAALGHLGTIGERTRPPLRETIGAARSGLYDIATASTSEFNRNRIADLADTIENNLQSRPPFFRDRFAPETFAAIRELRNMPWLQPGLHPTVADLDQVLQLLTHATRAVDGRERQAAGMAQQMITDYLRNPPAAAIRSGDPQRDAATLLEARRLHRIDKRTESIENAERQARMRTASTGYGGNINNVTRQEARKLLTGGDRRNWSDEDVEGLEAVVDGSFTNNTLRFIGKWAPATPLSGMAAVWEAAKGNYDIAATLAVAGFAAKKAADVGTIRALRDQAARLARSSGFPDRPPAAGMIPLRAAPVLAPAAGVASGDIADPLGQDALMKRVDDVLR